MKYEKLLVIFGVFIVAVVLHTLYFGREYFTGSQASLRTPLTKENVQALVDDYVLDYLSVYQKFQDLKSKDPRIIYRLKTMGAELNTMNDQYPMIQFTIAGIKYSDYPGIALEDLTYVKQFITYRIGSSIFSDALKPAELLDLDQFSARMRAFVAFLTDRASLARIQLPTDFQTASQTILTNILKLKQNLVSMKPESIPILKADVYTFVASFARNNFIEEPEFKTSEIPVVNTSNLPIKKSSLQDIAAAVKDTIAPAAKAVAASTAPVAPLAPTASKIAPAQTGYKFSELVDMLLTYSPLRTTAQGQIQPQPQQLTSSAADHLNTQYAVAGAVGSPTMTSNVFFDQIRTVVRDELKGVKEGPKDVVNKELADRATGALKKDESAESTEKVRTNSLEQGKWFRTAADGNCPYAQAQQMAVGAEPVPVPPFNMDDYIRKDSIPCWACTLK